MLLLILKVNWMPLRGGESTIYVFVLKNALFLFKLL